jgi:hypothetical protein
MGVKTSNSETPKKNYLFRVTNYCHSDPSLSCRNTHTHHSLTHSLTTGLVRDRVSYLPHTPHSVVSTMSWVIGVGIYMVGSVSVNFGTNLAKLSIARNDLLAIEKHRSIVTQPIWIVGRCCEHVVACLGACTDAIGL